MLGQLFSLERFAGGERGGVGRKRSHDHPTRETACRSFDDHFSIFSRRHDANDDRKSGLCAVPGVEGVILGRIIEQ